MIGARRGFTIIELSVAITAGTVLLVMSIHSLQQNRWHSGVQQSSNNLTLLGIAHAIYAADWNGRQYTQIVDDLSSYGDTRVIAYPAYREAHGDDHPPILLGWTFDSGPVAYWMSHAGNWGLPQPMVFTGSSNQVAFGSFRIPNAKGFHDYVSGRLYAPEFFAPNDVVAYGLVEPLFDEPESFNSGAGVSNLYWSSYCTSPAAMFDPQVMRHPNDGGWRHPWSFADAFTSPSMSDATYPSLKTHMLEHHWNQNAPADRCIAGYGGAYDGCSPYFFNHSIASEPVALFYDLSVRLLQVTEAVAADEQILQQTGHGLWSRDTSLGGEPDGGYVMRLAVDEVRTSFHILTTDGIHGRDTVSLAASRGTAGAARLHRTTSRTGPGRPTPR